MKDYAKMPTLADKVHASCFVKGNGDAFFGPNELHRKLVTAHRFVLDKGMSIMLADIATGAYATKSRHLTLPAIEAMRMGSRLPFKTTWIEYEYRECHRRMREYDGGRTIISLDGKTATPDEVPLNEGWLLEQHPQIDTAFRATIYLYDDKLDYKGYNLWSFPWSYVWTVDDSPLPWQHMAVGDLPIIKSEKELGSLVTGIIGYDSPHVGLQCSDVFHRASKMQQAALIELIVEWAGTLRRIWSLLTTINDLPIAMRDVKATKGFFGGRNYRPYLDHKTITLTVPQDQYRKIARSVIAKARRRAHMVRGHWRNDYRHPLSPLCEHIYLPAEGYNECRLCKGRKLWIGEHQRGDATLGFVSHDYELHPHD